MTRLTRRCQFAAPRPRFDRAPPPTPHRRRHLPSSRRLRRALQSSVGTLSYCLRWPVQLPSVHPPVRCASCFSRQGARPPAATLQRSRSLLHQAVCTTSFPLISTSRARCHARHRAVAQLHAHCIPRMALPHRPCTCSVISPLHPRSTSCASMLGEFKRSDRATNGRSLINVCECQEEGSASGCRSTCNSVNGVGTLVCAAM